MAEVLFVTPITPGRGGGGCIASLAILQALRRTGWDVHLVLNCGGAGLEVAEEARALCREITLVPRLPSTRTPRVRGLRCLLRYGYWPRYQRELWEVVRPLLRSGRYDLLFLDHLLVVECGRFAKEGGCTIPIVLREHNVESELQRRALPYLRSARLFVEAVARIRRWRAIESNLARYCDLALPISAVDAAKLSALSPGFPIVPIPSPVDTDHFRPAMRARGKEIVFIGGLGWRPNEDGIRWFVEEVLSAVRARHADAYLTVIGDSPPEWLRRHPHVSAVGFVVDERPLLARARVVIVPIRFGSGVRMKILNSLAMAKAVVSTRLGAEGIPVRNRHSILLADDAAAFADAVCTLLEDDGWVERLGRNGLRVCLDHYGPTRLSGRLDDVLRAGGRAAAEGPRRRPA